jgi:ABC-type polysaccharide/polyol phosphate transport system ATPase subunit
LIILQHQIRNGKIIGILGLPNVGKSSFFNLLTDQAVAAENYPVRIQIKMTNLLDSDLAIAMGCFFGYSTLNLSILKLVCIVLHH